MPSSDLNLRHNYIIIGLSQTGAHMYDPKKSGEQKENLDPHINQQGSSQHIPMHPSRVQYYHQEHKVPPTCKFQNDMRY